MNRIWAIGASVRALAQSLIASGYEVVAADLFNDLDLQRIARTQRIIDYPDDLLNLVDAVEADAFVYTGGLENYPNLIDTLAKKLPLLGNPGKVLRRVRDVPTLQAALARGGFQMPPTAKTLPLATDARWLRKSQDSSGGLRIAWAGSNPAPVRGEEYFQEFIDGTVYGASFLAAAEVTKLLGVARQLTDCPWTKAPRFCYAGSIGPIRLPDELQREVERLGAYLASEFQVRGWFGIDFIVVRGQLWVLEVNPRYTASMELFKSAAPPFSGKAVLYTKCGICIASDFVQRLMPRIDVADIPSPGTEIPAGSPVLSLFAWGPSEAAVTTQLQTKTEELHAELFAASTADAVAR